MSRSRADIVDALRALSATLNEPATLADPRAYGQLAKEQAELERQVAAYDAVHRLEAEVVSLEELLATEADPEMQTMATTECGEKQDQLRQARLDLQELLRPRDPRDDKPAILEIRAGAGGDESSLFAAELYGMYVRFAESHQWKVDLYSSSPSEAGGFKEIIFSVAGEGVYGQLKFEAGTHRVQRVPATESQGRIHTSTVTVAVLPEAEESDIEIKPDELRIDVFRSSGPGGQSVNTTDSAVRITHVPTGVTATSQDEKSQHKNRAKALSVLRSRIIAARDEALAKERGDARRAQVGTGERSEKIRTYNFPQDRLTDHRINYTTHGLEKIMSGALDGVIEALRRAAANTDVTDS